MVSPNPDGAAATSVPPLREHVPTRSNFTFSLVGMLKDPDPEPRAAMPQEEASQIPLYPPEAEKESSI
jgi:hypothetical protein